ncbi:MAG: hypothetical protein ACRC9E_05880 [Plesiomonas shigelloides]
MLLKRGNLSFIDSEQTKTAVHQDRRFFIFAVPACAKNRGLALQYAGESVAENGRAETDFCAVLVQ